MFNKNIRSYEVSIWTLQDSFITVLKQSNLENKGQIQDAKMTISDDGTRELSFSLPMYYYEGPNKIENPNWYNVRNGNLLVNMRKIKVIFNKGTDLEEVFEFIITKVTERHEDGELVCDVECEGLAFHELGKIGYKISLSQDDYLDEWSKWSTEIYDISNENAVKKHNAAEPKNNIDYWMGKVLKDTNWTYSIQMDWSGIDGMVIIKDEQNGYPLVGWAIVDKTRLYNGELMYAQLIPYSSLTPEEREQVNAAREGKNLRRCDKIYEDEYVSSWAQVDDSLTPAVTEKRREKYRLFDEEESNIYNLTQTIAETFGVHCKYVYHYDENYHIIGREVVFYNNFLQETTGEISITYPYHAHTIEREMDGTDIVTKMFVKSLDDENTESGWATIMDTEANKSGEDYLLDFDYLYEVGTISKEQYQEIEKYEATLHDLNIQLAPLNNQLVRYQDELIDVSAAKKIARDAMTLDDERISAQDDLLNNLTGGTGRITVDNRSPDLCYLMAMDDVPGYYYIRVRQIGIIANTLQIYKDYNPTSTELSNPISAYDLDYDEFGNLTGKVFKLTKDAEGLPALVYVTYSYEPQLYYENIKKMWQLRKDKDKREYDKQATREEQLDGKKDENGNRVSDGLIQKLEKQINDILEQKEALVKAFERMMGPALREGTWQPEDDYANYGDKYSINLPLNINSQYTNDLSSIGWDNELFDDEDKLYYKYSAAQKNIYYPCVNLEGLMDRFTDVALAEKGIPNLTLDNLSLVFQDMDYAAIENPRFFRYFGFNSQCHLAFVWRHGSDSVMPVLIVEGVESLPTDFDITNEAITHARIGYLNITVTDEGVTNQVIDVISEGEMTWINKEDLENYDIVYPRVKINSSYLKNSEDEISLMLGNEVLDSYYDYYVLSREEINNQGQYANTYFITIKPDAIFRKGSLPQVCRANYCISNTGLLIYLDAIQVLKENAYPKVSYTVDPSVMTTEFVQQAYRTLDKIIRLNDDELKFENVRGYVSELELDLDHPWEDEITITNYKTKFEDLFSNIVAQTEEMKKNSYIIGMAASIFTDKGQLSSDAIQGTILRADLNYAFNQGTLTIDEANGIWGTSDDGAVAFRGGGIFTATEQDADGNWVWNTGILPSGINANLITTGQLDTNLIRIYAGDNLKFQMNGDGLFAYKSWLNDVPAEGSAAETTKADQYKKNVFVPGQYVVHNSEGLFFTAKKGSMVLDEAKENYVEVKQDVDRVAISWDGLTIRNWNNEKVFYADGNGDLTLTGTIHALAGDFKGNVKATSLTIINGENEEETSIDDYLGGKIDENNEEIYQAFEAADGELKSYISRVQDGLSFKPDAEENNEAKDLAISLNNYINELSISHDNLICVWFYEGIPNLTSEPAQAWAQDSDKQAHIGDIYFNNTNFYWWNGTEWSLGSNTDLLNKLFFVSHHNDVQDRLRRVYLGEENPTTPYDIGDTWIKSNTEIYRSQSNNSTANFNLSDWIAYDEFINYNVLGAQASSFKQTIDGLEMTVTNLNNYVQVNVSADGIYSLLQSNKDYAQQQQDIADFMEGIQEQVDGKIETYYQKDDPLTGLSNAEKEKHVGDIWYCTATAEEDPAHGQKSFMFDGTTLTWKEMTTEVPSYLIDVINGKKNIFTYQPSEMYKAVPYNRGDLWVQPTPPSSNSDSTWTGNIYTCNISEGSPATVYRFSDWSLVSSTYTLAKQGVDYFSWIVNNPAGSSSTSFTLTQNFINAAAQQIRFEATESFTAAVQSIVEEPDLSGYVQQATLETYLILVGDKNTDPYGREPGVYVGTSERPGERPKTEAFIDARTGSFKVLISGKIANELGANLQYLGNLKIYQTSEGGHAFINDFSRSN